MHVSRKSRDSIGRKQFYMAFLEFSRKCLLQLRIAGDMTVGDATN